MPGKFPLSAILAITALGGVSASAIADEANWYAAADLGRSHYGTGSVLGGIADTSPTAYRLTGGYQWSPYLGFEAGYTDLGRASIDLSHVGGLFHCEAVALCDEGESSKVTVFSVSAVARYPFNESWSVVGRLGEGRVRDDAKAILLDEGTKKTFVSSNTTNAWKITYGIGVNWNFSSQWSAQLGWDQYRKLPTYYAFRASVSNVGVSSIGFAYAF